MAKIHLDRLRKKYEGVSVSGNKYSELMKQIIASNTEAVQNKIAKVQQDKWSNLAKRLRPSEEKKMVLPDLSDVLPKRSISARKAAEQGELIRDSLRDQLTKTLRARLETTSAEGKQSFVTRRGSLSGRINKKVVQGFQEDITQVFSAYTKRNPEFGMPTNIHNIAVTEVRSAVNEIKNEYTSRVIANNPDIVVKKRWIQNKGLSSIPRPGHSSVNGKTVEYNEYFEVPRLKMVKGKLVKIGVNLMRHPHDPTAPADQVIGCNCDYDIIVTKRRK